MVMLSVEDDNEVDLFKDFEEIKFVFLVSEEVL